ncbi:MAG: FAD-dependent oxidoreductase [Acidobacteriaceae bacterium]
MTTHSFDAVIVGGGIVGAACASALSQEGMRVALVERGEIGGGATSAAMGHIVVLDDSPAQLALTWYSQLLWREIAPELPAAAEYSARGTLWVAADDEEMREIRRRHDVYSKYEIPCQVIDAQALANLEPNLRPGLAGGFVVTSDAVVSPQIATRLFLQQAADRKAVLVQGDATSMSHGKVRLGSGEQLHAPILINAAGEWASALVPGLPVANRKGHLAITSPYPGFLRYQVVELGYLKSAHVTTTDTVACNVQPRQNGQLLIGSSRQFGIESREVDQRLMARMLERATEYIPGLQSLSVERTWTGFRCATPDKLPLIGRSVDDETVFLATGHEGLGITTSLATARLLADSLTGKTPAISVEPYLPSRGIVAPDFPLPAG